MTANANVFLIHFAFQSRHISLQVAERIDNERNIARAIGPIV